jgi:hypothetical protein
MCLLNLKLRIIYHKLIKLYIKFTGHVKKKKFISLYASLIRNWYQQNYIKLR